MSEMIGTCYASNSGALWFIIVGCSGVKFRYFYNSASYICFSTGDLSGIAEGNYKRIAGT